MRRTAQCCPEYHAVPDTHRRVFNLAVDPLELRDLSGETALVQRLDAELRLLLDPDATDARAKADQAARLSRG